MRETCNFFQNHIMDNNKNHYETKKQNINSTINLISPTLPDELLFCAPTTCFENFYNDSEETYEFWKDSKKDIDPFKQFICHNECESNELIAKKSYDSFDWQSNVSKWFPKTREWMENEPCNINDSYTLASFTLSDNDKSQTTPFLNSSMTPCTFPTPSFHSVCQPEYSQSLGSYFLINNNDNSENFSCNVSDSDKNISIESNHQINFLSEKKANIKKNSVTFTNELGHPFQQKFFYSTNKAYPLPQHLNDETQKENYVRISFPVVDENGSKRYLAYSSHVQNQSNVFKTSSYDMSYNADYSNTLHSETTESIQKTNLNITKNVTERNEIATNCFLKTGTPDVLFSNDNINEISYFSSKNRTNKYDDNVELENKDLLMEPHECYLNTRRKTLNPPCTENSRPTNSYMNLLENLDRFFPLSSGSRLPPPLPAQTLDICYTSDKTNNRSLPEHNIPTNFVRRSRAKTSPAISNPLTDKLFTTSEPHDDSGNTPFFQPIETMSSRFLAELENLHLEGPLSHVFPLPKFNFFRKSIDGTTTTTNNSNNHHEYNDSMLHNKSDTFNYPYFDLNTKNFIALSLCKELSPQTTDLQSSSCISFDKYDAMPQTNDKNKNSLPYTPIQENTLHEFDPSKDCYSWNKPQIMTNEQWNASLSDESNSIKKTTDFNQLTERLSSFKTPTLCKASLMYFPFPFEKHFHNSYNKVASWRHPSYLNSDSVTNSLTLHPSINDGAKNVTTNLLSQPISQIRQDDVSQSDDSHALQDFLHIQRQCRPCAFFYSKKKNCRNSYKCKFCHHSDHSIISMKQWKKGMLKKNVSMSVVHCST